MGAASSSSMRRIGVVLVVLWVGLFAGHSVPFAVAQEADEPPAGSVAPAGAPQVSGQSHTGVAAVGLALFLPPGRAGLAPSLSLSYSSFGKNGWLGAGFSLELSSIQRDVKRGLDFDAEAFTVTAGGSAAELVRRADWGPGFFGAKIESGFTKYRYLGDGGFEALSKDGKRLFFGTRPESRQEDAGAPRRVFRWSLERVEDANGNFMTVEYAKEAGELYPRRIRYTGHRNLAPAHEVVFHLEGRPDVLVKYSAGFEVVTARRLKTIEVRSGGAAVRAYGLFYDEAAGRSQLKRVELAGADAAVGAGGEIAGGSRRTVFSAQFSAEAANLAHGGLGIEASLLDQGGLYAGDFNGDGRSDLFFHRPESGANRVFLSTPEAGFARIERPIDRGQIDSGGDDEGGAIYAADFDGDGKTDIFYHRAQSGVNRLFLSDGQGGFRKAAEPIASGAVDGGEGDKGGQFYVGDFDGDGLVDLFYRRNKTGYHRLFANQGGGRFAAGVKLFADKSLEEGALFAADFNGDGRSDLLFHRRGTGVNRLFLSRGGLAFSLNEAVFAQGLVADDGRLHLGDYNGDGLTDAIYFNSGLVRLFTNQGEGRFSYLENAALGLAAASELKGRLVAGDFSGSGMSDLFFFNLETGANRLCTARGDGGFVDRGGMLPAATVTAYANKWPLVVDVNGDGRPEALFHRKSTGVASLARGPEGLPGLLVRVENALGGESRLAYTPSSRFANKYMPFVVPVLSSVTSYDGISVEPAGRTLFSYEGVLSPTV